MTKTITSSNICQKQNSKSRSHIKSSKALDNSKSKTADSVSIQKTWENSKTLEVSGKRVGKRFRSRKDFDQMVVLNQMFKSDPSWSRTTVQYLKNKLGLKTSQIYKWGYDRKKIAEKEKLQLDDSNGLNLSTQDSYLTDNAIQDYNDAVDQIWDTAWIPDKFWHQQDIPIMSISDIHSSRLRDYSNNFHSKVRSENNRQKSEIRTSIDAERACAIDHTCGCRSYLCCQSSNNKLDKPSITNQTTTGHKDEQLPFNNMTLAPTRQTFIFEYDNNLMYNRHELKPIENPENLGFMDCFIDIPVQAPLMEINEDFSPSIDFDIW